VIDIDLERRRISLSLKQANEGVDPEAEEFLDPALYGMPQEYDEDGNYKYPEGFDPETNEWVEGYEAQRETWEQQYAAAQTRWEEHKKQVAKAIAADAEAGSADAGAGASADAAPATGPFSSEEAADEGTLASDEALAALREKLAGS
ncbi:MAG: 30S ribosomal protein S1, partial [Brevibacterium sp.]